MDVNGIYIANYVINSYTTLINAGACECGDELSGSIKYG